MEQIYLAKNVGGFVLYRNVTRNYVLVNSGTWFLNKLTSVCSSYLVQPTSPIATSVICKSAKYILLF